jgi:hypothetical protein
MLEGGGAVAVVAALLAFVLYGRIRRNFGRQKITVTRLAVRIGLLSLITALFLLTGLFSSPLAVLVGLGAGCALGVYAVGVTTFDYQPDATYYTPNTYVGLVVVGLLLGRAAWRVIRVGTAASAVALAQSGDLTPLGAVGLIRSPLTRGLLFTLLGYYITYYVGVLMRTRAARRSLTTRMP